MVGTRSSLCSLCPLWFLPSELPNSPYPFNRRTNSSAAS